MKRQDRIGRKTLARALRHFERAMKRARDRGDRAMVLRAPRELLRMVNNLPTSRGFPAAWVERRMLATHRCVVEMGMGLQAPASGRVMPERS